MQLSQSLRLRVSLILTLSGVFVLSYIAVAVYSQPAQQPPRELVSEKAVQLLAAGIAAGLAMAGAGIGLGTASAAAIGAIAEKPELLGRTLLFVVLIEAIAIYGLAVFFIIFARI